MGKLNFNIPGEPNPRTIKALEKGFGKAIVKSAVSNSLALAAGAVSQLAFNDRPDGVSRFGTFIYDTLFIERPEYDTFTWNEQKKTFNIDAPVLPGNHSIGEVFGLYCEGVIIDATCVNHIVYTQIAGADGGINEYINKGDVDLTIRGYFASVFPGKYPKQEVRDLRLYHEAPVAKKVTNNFLNNVLHIQNIVTEKLNIFQVQGMRNVQYFELTGRSESNYEIRDSI